MLRFTTINDLIYCGTVTEIRVNHKTGIFFGKTRRIVIPNHRNKIYEFRRWLETAWVCFI